MLSCCASALGTHLWAGDEQSDAKAGRDVRVVRAHCFTHTEVNMLVQPKEAEVCLICSQVFTELVLHYRS